MTRLTWAVTALVLSVVGLCGCKPPMEADISPDGNSTVIADSRGVVIHDVQNREPDRVFPIKNAQSPRFSPDGKWIALWQSNKTTLLDARSGSQITLPRIDPPFLWSPDNSEVVGIRGKTAVVVHVRSRSVVRKYSLPDVPNHGVWLGHDRDLVFSCPRMLVSVIDGKVSIHRTDQLIETVGINSNNHRVVWVEASNTKEPKGMNNFDVSVKEIDTSMQGTETLVLKSTSDRLLGEPGRLCMPTTLSISPDGRQLAILGITDVSRPGLVDELMALEAKNQNSSHPKTSRQKELESQLRLASMCQTTRLDGLDIRPIQIVSSEGFAFFWSVSWTSNGQQIAVGLNDKVFVKSIPTY